jgi:hypothetical protein
LSEAPFDILQAHRWFAMEANNRAWSLAEAPTRSSAEIEEMIGAAHTAAWHWHHVGEPLNELRAQFLLTTAYGVAGREEGAALHAEQCLKLSESVGWEQSAFDRACVHGAAALAFRIGFHHREAREQYALALDAAKQLSEPGEQEVFTRLYVLP